MSKDYSTAAYTDWMSTLPTKSIGVKIIIKSAQGNVLLVKPAYKPGWQFPGGGVEPQEGPKDAAVRELQEELGLTITHADIALLDTVFRPEHENIILMYAYKPLLSESAAITYPPSELEGYKFEDPRRVASQIGTYYTTFLRSFPL